MSISGGAPTGCRSLAALPAVCSLSDAGFSAGLCNAASSALDGRHNRPKELYTPDTEEQFHCDVSSRHAVKMSFTRMQQNTDDGDGTALGVHRREDSLVRQVVDAESHFGVAQHCANALPEAEARLLGVLPRLLLLSWSADLAEGRKVRCCRHICCLCFVSHRLQRIIKLLLRRSQATVALLYCSATAIDCYPA